MQDALFYIFAFLTLVFGFLVIANPFSRNPVTSAMFLVLTIVSLAGLFVLLHAFFLAAVQVLVYAGAVMVLFLFVIMLLDLKAEERRKIKTLGIVGGLVSVGAILAIFLSSLLQGPARCRPNRRTLEGGTVRSAKLLFTPIPAAVRDRLGAAARRDGGRGAAQQEGPEMNVGLEHYLVVSVLLFCLGLLGVIVRRNLLVIYMSLELMLNAANLALVAFSRFTDNLDGQVFVFFIITVAAAEVAVGLALIVALYRKRQTAHVEDLTTLKL